MHTIYGIEEMNALDTNDTWNLINELLENNKVIDMITKC